MTISTEDIDHNLRERLERLREERGVSFGQIVNEVIRAGLDVLEVSPSKREPVTTRTFDAGEPFFSSPEELKALITQLDEEEARRKLGLK